MRNTKIITGLFLLVLVFACKDKEEDQGTVFEKKEIMQQLADAYIQPAYLDFQAKINALESSWSAYLINSTTLNLQAVQENWKTAYLSFQHAKIFDFGPAMDIGFAAAVGTFPSDTTQIKNNIAAGTYDLATISNIAAIGLPALDYLFYKNNAVAELASESNRRQYVTALIQKMKNEINMLVSAWTGYESTFIDGTGTSSTSPFSLLVNAFCKDFELAKNAKLGIPIGKQSLGIQRPDYLEARNSGFSTALLKESFKALRSVYLGNGFDGSTGKGFDDYLIALEKSSLAQTIDDRFASIIAQPDSWSGTLENAMQANPATLNAYYDYIQGTVVNLKADMASAFGILITYQDNDGD